VCAECFPDKPIGPLCPECVARQPPTMARPGWLTLALVLLWADPVGVLTDFVGKQKTFPRLVDPASAPWIKAMTAVEIVGSIAFACVAMLLVRRFYARRADMPKLLSAFILLHYPQNMLRVELNSTHGARVFPFVFGLVYALAWTNYFLRSPRVKAYFTN